MINIYTKIILTFFVFGVCMEGFSQSRICQQTEHFCDFDAFDDREVVELRPPNTSHNCKGELITNPVWYAFVAGTSDITLTAMRRECVPGSPPGAGIMITVWEECPNSFVNSCIGTTSCPYGPLGNPPNIQLKISAGDMIPGGIYYISVSGCGGAQCQYQLDITGESFKVPNLDAPDSRLVVEGCTSNLPPFTYCEGNTIFVEADGEHFDDAAGMWKWSINELDMMADASTVAWKGSFNEGVGNPVNNGGLAKFNMGRNGMEFNFQEVGQYEICLDHIGTNCGNAPGSPICQAITIVPPPELQKFAVHEICYSTLVDGGTWSGPPLPNAMGHTWVAGSISLQDVLSAPQDDDDNYMVRKTSPPDKCGCEYEQEVLIDLVGDADPGEVELFLMECQLPYDWFDITIFEMDDYQQTPVRLSQASQERNFQGMACDSFVELTIVEREFEAFIEQTDCTEDGAEFTFMIDGIDLQGADFLWIDADTGMDATTFDEDPSAVLPTGNYFVYVSGFIEDLNHNENSQGTSPLDFIQCEFGPFELNNPFPDTPEVMPYDTFLCPDEQFNVEFTIDTIGDTLDLTYHWIIPTSLAGQAIFGQDSINLTIQDISGLADGDTLALYSMATCGVSDTLLIPVNLSEDPMAPQFSDRIECSGVPFTISYEFVPGYIYTWDFGGGTAIGNTTDGSDFQLVYEEAGIYSYSLRIETPDGCVTEAGPFMVEVFDLPAAPVISCTDRESTTALTFDWEEIAGLDYSVELNTPGVSGTIDGSSYIFDDLEPGTVVSISVTAMNDGPEECNSVTTELTCQTSPCDLPPIDFGNFSDRVFCQNSDTESVQFNIQLPQGLSGTYVGPAINSAGFLDLNHPDIQEPGDYMIEFIFQEDISGCEDSRSIVVTIQEAIDIALGDNFTLCLDEDMTLSPVVSGGDGGPYNFDWSTGANSAEISIPVNGEEAPGNYSLSVIVTDNSTVCETEKEVNYTVLDTVPIVTELIYNCNANGTEFDLTDDFYDVFINASWTHPDSAGQFAVYRDGEELGVFDYNSGGSFQLQADSSTAELLITDLSYQMCSVTESIGPLLACEPECEIQTSSIVLCDDNDTADPGDDFYSVRVVAFVTNPGVSNMFTLFVNGDSLGNFTYQAGAVFEFPAMGSVQIYLQDLDKPECNVSSSVNLTPCSFPRYQCDTSAINGLALQGPFSSVALNNEAVVREAQRFDNGVNQMFTALSVFAATDINKSTCHADSAEYEITVYESSQGLPGNIIDTYIIKTEPDSVDVWMKDGTEYKIANYLFEFDDAVNVKSGWVSISPVEDNCNFIWLSGDNAPSTGGAILDTSGVWMIRKSKNYCFFFESTSTVDPAFEGIRIYPVPSYSFVNAENLANITEIEVYDIHGRRIMVKTDVKYNERIDMTTWQPGIYLLVLRNDEGQRQTYKLIHQR